MSFTKSVNQIVLKSDIFEAFYYLDNSKSLEKQRVVKTFSFSLI